MAAIAAFIMAVLSLVGSYVGEVGHHAPPPSVVCQEDEPCWNCHTMGNLICGEETK